MKMYDTTALLAGPKVGEAVGGKVESDIIVTKSIVMRVHTLFWLLLGCESAMKMSEKNVMQQHTVFGF